MVIAPPFTVALASPFSVAAAPETSALAVPLAVKVAVAFWSIFRPETLMSATEEISTPLVASIIIFDFDFILNKKEQKVYITPKNGQSEAILEYMGG